MDESRFKVAGFDLRVVAAILVAAAAIGVANNLLVGGERRVPWTGEGIVADSAADVDAGDPIDDDAGEPEGEEVGE